MKRDSSQGDEPSPVDSHDNNRETTPRGAAVAMLYVAALVAALVVIMLVVF